MRWPYEAANLARMARAVLRDGVAPIADRILATQVLRRVSIGGRVTFVEGDRLRWAFNRRRREAADLVRLYRA